jgi:hypothetical protein
MRQLITPSAIRLSSVRTDPIRIGPIHRSPGRVDFWHRWGHLPRDLDREGSRAGARQAPLRGTG